MQKVALFVCEVITDKLTFLENIPIVHCSGVTEDKKNHPFFSPIKVFPTEDNQ